VDDPVVVPVCRDDLGHLFRQLPVKVNNYPLAVDKAQDGKGFCLEVELAAGS